MVRFATHCLLAAAVLNSLATVGAQPKEDPGPGPERDVAPSMYELVINGESFVIESNRALKLQSKQKPGVGYDVALRVAPTQRLRLNSVQFDYDWLAKVTDDHDRQQRTAKLSHELGFTIRITDLGRPLTPEILDKVLTILSNSAIETFRELKVANLEIGKPSDRAFNGTTGRGLVVRYRDPQGLGRSCLIYVLNGPKFAVSCVVHYLDRDFENASPLMKKTLDSFRAVP